MPTSQINQSIYIQKAQLLLIAKARHLAHEFYTKSDKDFNVLFERTLTSIVFTKYSKSQDQSNSLMYLPDCQTGSVLVATLHAAPVSFISFIDDSKSSKSCNSGCKNKTCAQIKQQYTEGLFLQEAGQYGLQRTPMK